MVLVKNTIKSIYDNMKNNNEIVVYWASIPGNSPQGTFLNFKDPEPIIKELKKLGERLITGADESHNFLRCPSVINNVKNTFSFSSPINLKIEWKDKRISTPEGNQEFFDRFISPRNPASGFLSANQFHTVFFTEEPSLIAKQKVAIYTENDFTRKTGLLEGQIDIGNWFRALDIAFYFKSEDVVNIKIDDILYYLEFVTEKKIVFKRFHITDRTKTLMDYCVDLKQHRKFSLKTYLEDCYMLFNRSKFKKQFLKEIKNNLSE